MISLNHLADGGRADGGRASLEGVCADPVCADLSLAEDGRACDLFSALLRYGLNSAPLMGASPALADDRCDLSAWLLLTAAWDSFCRSSSVMCPVWRTAEPDGLNLGPDACCMIDALVDGRAVLLAAALNTGLGAKPPLELPCTGWNRCSASGGGFCLEGGR